MARVPSLCLADDDETLEDEEPKTANSHIPSALLLSPTTSSISIQSPWVAPKPLNAAVQNPPVNESIVKNQCHEHSRFTDPNIKVLRQSTTGKVLTVTERLAADRRSFYRKMERERQELEKERFAAEGTETTFRPHVTPHPIHERLSSQQRQRGSFSKSTTSNDSGTDEEVEPATVTERLYMDAAQRVVARKWLTAEARSRELRENSEMQKQKLHRNRKETGSVASTAESEDKPRIPRVAQCYQEELRAKQERLAELCQKEDERTRPSFKPEINHRPQLPRPITTNHPAKKQPMRLSGAVSSPSPAASPRHIARREALLQRASTARDEYRGSFLERQQKDVLARQHSKERPMGQNIPPPKPEKKQTPPIDKQNTNEDQPTQLKENSPSQKQIPRQGLSRSQLEELSCRLHTRNTYSHNTELHEDMRAKTAALWAEESRRILQQNRRWYEKSKLLAAEAAKREEEEAEKERKALLACPLNVAEKIEKNVAGSPLHRRSVSRLQTPQPKPVRHVSTSERIAIAERQQRAEAAFAARVQLAEQMKESKVKEIEELESRGMQLPRKTRRPHNQPETLGISAQPTKLPLPQTVENSEPKEEQSTPQEGSDPRKNFKAQPLQVGNNVVTEHAARHPVPGLDAHLRRAAEIAKRKAEAERRLSGRPLRSAISRRVDPTTGQVTTQCQPFQLLEKHEQQTFERKIANFASNIAEREQMFKPTTATELYWKYHHSPQAALEQEDLFADMSEDEPESPRYRHSTVASIQRSSFSLDETLQEPEVAEEKFQRRLIAPAPSPGTSQKTSHTCSDQIQKLYRRRLFAPSE